MKHKFWKIEYISIEGRNKWCVARSPLVWKEYDVEQAICGGAGDDVDIITDISPTYDDVWTYDFE